MKPLEQHQAQSKQPYVPINTPATCPVCLQPHPLPELLTLTWHLPWEVSQAFHLNLPRGSWSPSNLPLLSLPFMVKGPTIPQVLKSKPDSLLYLPAPPSPSTNPISSRIQRLLTNPTATPGV